MAVAPENLIRANAWVLESTVRAGRASILYEQTRDMVILSTGFLIGFNKQLKSHMEKNRNKGAIGMAVALCITVLFAVKWKRLIGVVLRFPIDFLPFAYYRLSYLTYIPQVHPMPALYEAVESHSLNFSSPKVAQICQETVQTASVQTAMVQTMLQHPKLQNVSRDAMV